MLLYFSLCRPKWIHSERQLLRGHVWHGFENITSESKNAATFKGLQLAFMLFNNASESIIPMAFLAYCFKVLFDWVLWDLLYKSQRPIGSIVEISRSQWELKRECPSLRRFCFLWSIARVLETNHRALEKNQSNSNFDTIENWWNRKYLRYNVSIDKLISFFNFHRISWCMWRKVSSQAHRPWRRLSSLQVDRWENSSTSKF